jgi:hypothetical protein
MADWHGVTMQSNFTWWKALGSAAQAQSSSELDALDPFNLNRFCSTQTNGFRVNYFPDGVLQASNWHNPILGMKILSEGTEPIQR